MRQLFYKYLSFQHAIFFANRRLTLLWNDRGSIAVEFALTMTLFSMIAWISLVAIGKTANNQMNQTQTNFASVTTNNEPTGYSISNYEK